MEVLIGLVGSILAVLIGMAINMALRLGRLEGRVDEGFKRLDEKLDYLIHEFGRIEGNGGKGATQIEEHPKTEVKEE